MPAPDSVLALCETFALHRDHYRSSAYNETELRREFLDPFFKALGWDIDNEQGYADAYKDVIHEDAIKIGGITKAPDYCFRIGGTRKFFLEAKKPSVNIKDDISPAYQLRRYAWSGKLPLSILSDFEELAIYDCRSRPSPKDKPSKGRTFYCTFEDYGEKWDDIAAIFSRESVLKGSFDKYAETSKGKRGTEEVDDAFLSEIERWRELIAKNLALRNQSLSQRDLNFSVQKIIDRIIFLRICEDRGSEDYERLRKRLTGKDLYPILLDEFKRADDRYNSGLFHFTTEKDRPEAPDTLTTSLSLDDKVLKDIVKNLYYPDSPYEFSVFSADILGQVYEQFLGKTIQLTPSHQAKIEEKPEVRKAGGVYYTPKYIVDYIVENTLGKILNGEPSFQAASSTSTMKKPAIGTALQQPLSIAKAAEVKVLDPACGSGSFLIVAYQYLLDWHRDQYTIDPKTLLPDEKKSAKHSKGKNPVIYQAQGGEWKLTIAERKRILLNNIHGVDIDSQAVEVTKLSLLLKVLEGETATTTQRDFLKERQRILPDLGDNIKCGNSLIGPDFYDQPDLPDLDEETKYRINVFDWETGFPTVFKKGGFDCVIGNPPYDVLEKEREKSIKDNEDKSKDEQEADRPHQFLSSFVRRSPDLAPGLGGKLNLFRFFLIKTCDILVAKGRMGMITPLSIIADVSCAKTRRYLLTKLDQISADCFPQKDSRARRVFRDAKLSTVVICGRKSRSKNSTITMRSFPGRLFTDVAITNKLALKEIELIDKKNLPIPVCSAATWALLTSVHQRQSVRRAKDVDDICITRGEINQTTFRKFIYAESEAPSDYERLVKGSELGRFKIHTTLTQGQRERLDALGYLKGKAARTDSFVKRIALQRITGMDDYWRLVGTIIEPVAYFADSTNSILISSNSKLSLSYILGLLNSKFSQWAFKIFSSNNNVGTNELDLLPIRTIDFTSAADGALHDKMVALVESMLTLHEKQATEKNPNTLRMLATEIIATDRRIDRLVYELYALTEEEIALVEA